MLQIYGLHQSKEAVLSTSTLLGGASVAVDLKRVDIYMQYSIQLKTGDVSAYDLAGDSRCLLIAYSDGSLQLVSWQAKVCA